MCGIWGSFDKSTFDVLYKANKERGDFAFGSLAISKDTSFNTFKCKGSMKMRDIPETYKLYLGHTQAPTSSERDWHEDTSHPFDYSDWFVAHNGVLTNFKELNSEFVPWNCNKVDSSVIPAMLQEEENNDNKKSEIEIITTVLERLKGTYAVWIYNSSSANTYLARQGSTLFGNMLKGDFSSVSGKGYESLEEGILYLITTEGITEVGMYGFDSPFFTL